MIKSGFTKFSLLLSFLAIQNLKAQDTIQFYSASRIDSSNLEVSAILDVYRSYFTPDSIGKYKFDHWNSAEEKKRI